MCITNYIKRGREKNYKLWFKSLVQNQTPLCMHKIFLKEYSSNGDIVGLQVGEMNVWEILAKGRFFFLLNDFCDLNFKPYENTITLDEMNLVLKT